MIWHSEISDNGLRSKIKQQEICLGGNSKLKIYGTLSCTSGKKMKRENRVCFLTKRKLLQTAFAPADIV